MSKHALFKIGCHTNIIAIVRAVQYINLKNFHFFGYNESSEISFSRQLSIHPPALGGRTLDLTKAVQNVQGLSNRLFLRLRRMDREQVAIKKLDLT